MPGLNDIRLQDFKVELLGTFVYTWIGGWAYIHSIKDANSDTCSVALAHMVTMMLMIWVTYKPTGGHYNPIITFNMNGICQVAAQFLGALLGSSMLKVLCDNSYSAVFDGRIINGFPSLENTIVYWKVLILEIVGSILLMVVVYMTNLVDFKAENVNGPSIGGVYGFLILISPPNSPIAINPFRAICPAIVSADLANWSLIWIYLLGPLLGAIIGSLLGEVLSNGYNPDPYCLNRGMSKLQMEEKSSETELTSRSSQDIENGTIRQSEILQSNGNIDNLEINNGDRMQAGFEADIDMNDE